MNGLQFFPFPIQQDRPPPSVAVALDFLNALSFKTMTRATATDHQVVEIEGQMLDVKERKAQQDAWTLLSRYFREPFETQKPSTIAVTCPACAAAGQYSYNCPLCAGRGVAEVIKAV